MASKGIPFVISAPSGTGKTTICHALIQRDPQVVFSISHTTRTKREGETDGKDYHFVSKKEFRRLVEASAFLETAEYGGNLYGTSWQSIREPLEEGLDVALEIEIQGARQVRERLEEARLIFIVPPSMEELERRLRDRRTDSQEVIEGRLAMAREELRAYEWYDYVVINDDVEQAIGQVLDIVAGERAGQGEALKGKFGQEAALKLLRGRFDILG